MWADLSGLDERPDWALGSAQIRQGLKTLGKRRVPVHEPQLESRRPCTTKPRRGSEPPSSSSRSTSAHDFYLALADTQWRLGRLVPAVSKIAFEIIDTGRDLRRWEYSPPFHRKRRKVLADLRGRLMSPPPAPRAVRRQADYATSLVPGDVIRYNTASGDDFMLAVVGVDQSNNQRIAIVRPLEGNVTSAPAVARDLSNLRLLPHAQPLALFPYRGVDFPAKRSEVILRAGRCLQLTDKTVSSAAVSSRGV